MSKATEKKQAGAGADAAIVKVETMTEAVDKFCAAGSFSPAEERNIRTAVDVILKAKKAIVENVLAIGDRLNTLRTEIGSDKFGTFAANVLPKLGISKANAYKLMANASVLARAIPNPTVRGFLLSQNDGRGIVTAVDADGKYAPQLSASAQIALKKIGPMPKATDDVAGAEQWAGNFSRTMRKVRTESRKSGSALGRERARIVKAFTAYMRKHGTKAAEQLLNYLDGIHTKVANQEELAEDADSKAAKQAKAAA